MRGRTEHHDESKISRLPGLSGLLGIPGDVSGSGILRLLWFLRVLCLLRQASTRLFVTVTV